MQTIKDAVEKLTNATSDEVKGWSGGILYSAAKTLSPGKYYFLGINPGGSGGAAKISQHLQGLSTKTNNDLREPRWPWRGNGIHPLQRNAQFLFDELESDKGYLDQVCASNLIFKQQPREHGLSQKDAEACWSVHLAILDIVQPSVIITHGRRSFDFLSSKLVTCPLLPPQDAEHGNWVCRAAKGLLPESNKPCLLIGLPHLSRYSLPGKNEVIPWMKGLIADHEQGI